MTITVKHICGVGANATYAIYSDGERVGSIEMVSNGSTRAWGIRDTYDHVLHRGLRSKDDAAVALMTGTITLPSVQDSYTAAWGRVYDSRKTQAERHLAKKLLEIVHDVAMGTNSAPEKALEIVQTIERAARGETDLEFQYQSDGGHTYTARPVVGNFPEPPKVKVKVA